MKKIINYALMAFVPLLASCLGGESEDVCEGLEVGTGVVKAEFAITIPNQYGAGTRMQPADVQAAGTTEQFRGMTDIRLFPFTSSATDASGEAVVTADSPFSGFTAISSGSNVLPTISAGAAFDHATGTNDKWYADVQIPTGTNAFLVYGRAIAPAEPTVVDNFKYGKLTPSFDLQNASETPREKIKFNLTNIYSETTQLEQQSEAVELAALLNKVLAAKGYISITTQKSFYEVTQSDNEAVYRIIEEFKKLKSGSSENIRLTLQNLYNVCMTTEVAKPSGQKSLTEVICETILESSSSSESPLKLNASFADDTYTLTWNTDPEYPGKYNVPEGVVALKYDNTSHQFSFQSTSVVLGEGYEFLQASKLVYPAELYYFANTSVRTSAEQLSKINWSYTDWEGGFIKNYLKEASREVTSSTQSIALAKQLNYAVGRLDTKVQFDPGTIKGSDDKAVAVPATGFPCTAVLIGGQRNVDWEFKSENTGSTEELTIYDRNVIENVTAIQGASKTISHTLVLQTKGVDTKDSPVAAGTNDETLQVALEFTNNSATFMGKDGVIPFGGKFYLVGKVKLSDATEATKGNHKYVFEQDYVTTADFTISSLKNAYNVIPDLSVPQLELGMSVNLSWQQGVYIPVTIE